MQSAVLDYHSLTLAHYHYYHDAREALGVTTAAFWGRMLLLSPNQQCEWVHWRQPGHSSNRHHPFLIHQLIVTAHRLCWLMM